MFSNFLTRLRGPVRGLPDEGHRAGPERRHRVGQPDRAAARRHGQQVDQFAQLTSGERDKDTKKKDKEEKVDRKRPIPIKRKVKEPSTERKY